MKCLKSVLYFWKADSNSHMWSERQHTHSYRDTYPLLKSGQFKSDNTIVTLFYGQYHFYVRCKVGLAFLLRLCLLIVSQVAFTINIKWITHLSYTQYSEQICSFVWQSNHLIGSVKSWCFKRRHDISF